MKIEVTKNSFGKKALATIINTKEFKLFNVFGFGLWIYSIKPTTTKHN